MRKLCVDVSHWDGNVDYKKWIDHRGLWGVIVKAGGNEGGRYRDSTFESNYAKAKAAGLHVGAYYYTTSTTTSAAKADAEHFNGLLKGKSFDLPCYIDVEDARQTQIGKRRLTDVVLTFIKTVELAGRKGGVYTSGSWWSNCVYADELKPYACWIAWWTSQRPASIYDCGMWQQGGMRLSDGDIVFADKSGYTDCNWCFVDYPSTTKSETPETTATALTYPDAAVEVMDHFIDHDAHGYSQIHRDGTSDVETITLTDGTKVSFQGGDRDCSRLVQTCYVVVGALPRGMHMWTGNERDILLANGFKEVSLSNLQRGDVLWRKGHTELYLGDNMEGGARRSENHSIDGKTGDQDGLEIARSKYVRSNWTHAYRCTKVRQGSVKEPVKLPVQVAGEAKNDLGLEYRAHVQDLGWLAKVHDGQTAGTTGSALRIEGMGIVPPKGVVFDVEEHIRDIGWRKHVGVQRGVSEPLIGTTYQGKRLEAIRIDIRSIPDELKGKKLKMQAHVQDDGWLPIVGENQICGTVGKAKRLEAIRMWFE